MGEPAEEVQTAATAQPAWLRELARDPAVARLGMTRAQARHRAGLVATQLLGLGLCRYALRLPPVVALSRTEIVAWLGPTLQRYLTGVR